MMKLNWWHLPVSLERVRLLLALAAALQKHETYKQILLARPIIALANKDLGYLPGDEKHKIAPICSHCLIT